MQLDRRHHRARRRPSGAGSYRVHHAHQSGAVLAAGSVGVGRLAVLGRHAARTTAAARDYGLLVRALPRKGHRRLHPRLRERRNPAPRSALPSAHRYAHRSASRSAPRSAPHDISITHTLPTPPPECPETQVYQDRTNIGSKLAGQIIDAATAPLSTSVFASIWFSGSSYAGPRQFDQLLADAAARTPLALVYGKQDPWVTKEWGLRAHRRASSAGNAVPMYEISPCGHCAHHEAPNTLNNLVADWVGAVEAGYTHGGAAAPAGGIVSEDGDVREVVCEKVDGEVRRDWREHLAYWLWK